MIEERKLHHRDNNSLHMQPTTLHHRGSRPRPRRAVQGLLGRGAPLAPDEGYAAVQELQDLLAGEAERWT